MLIENQLERTDHTHLGQLLTYAAGLHAVTIVWLAQRFTDDHRAALDWLNECTSQNINFFGLEIELWRIGDSPVAPKFNVVSQPNNWSRQAGAGGGTTGLTETRQLQLAFWTQFRSYLLDNRSTVNPTKPLPQHYMALALGRPGFTLNGVVSSWDVEAEAYGAGELRAEVVISHERAKAFYEALFAQKQQIESAFGEPLTWHNPPNARRCHTYARRAADIRDRAQWPEQHAWLKSKLEALDRVFRPIIRTLEVGEQAAAE